ncbi:GNAT family N-acetyltransferase [Rhizobium sp. GCM10022189]|uniref:GNAT family N-acetyltransferase n=1 Tax=Rhizobium sp. GCM10022189 TaxID=3252654 RepID=UPI003618C54F
MTDADRQAVGVVGFAASAASDPREDGDRDPDAIERARQEFATFANKTARDIVVAELDREVSLSLRIDEGGASGNGATRDTCEHIGAIRLYERCGFSIIWHGIEFSERMGASLEKVHLEKRLTD